LQSKDKQDEPIEVIMQINLHSKILKAQFTVIGLQNTRRKGLYDFFVEDNQIIRTTSRKGIPQVLPVIVVPISMFNTV
jgi:hypothetical protein